MRIGSCKVNHLNDPLGYAMETPVFSYIVEQAQGTRQAAGRIRIAGDAQMTQILFDSGWDEDMDSLAYEAALKLTPRTRYYWTVSVRTDAGDEGTSDVHWFETAKQDEPWTGKWITCSAAEPRHPIFFRAVRVEKPLRAARLYICGLGLYRAFWIGRPIGDEWLTPYCNNYRQWLQYQTYDVTQQLTGSGELSILLGNGWYKGRFGFASRPALGATGN